MDIPVMTVYDLHTQHMTIVAAMPLLSHFLCAYDKIFCKQHIVFTVIAFVHEDLG